MIRAETMPRLIAMASRVQTLLTEQGIDRIGAFLNSVQDSSGGFRDRAGRPDVYYTVFGLSSALALGDDVPRIRKVRDFLNAHRELSALSFAHLVSLIRCYNCLRAADGGDTADEARGRDLMERLTVYRTADGGFSHETMHGTHSTAYALFLVLQAQEDTGIAIMDPLVVQTLLPKLAAADGGYSNHGGARCGVTTATASAAILLTQTGDVSRGRQALDYVETMRTADNGYRASPGTPHADLLSTATALYARSLCGFSLDGQVLDATAGFVEGLWSDRGGFVGHPADSLPDAEYTFYALLSFGALCEMAERDRIKNAKW